jgi:site-specific recombinase XerC
LAERDRAIVALLSGSGLRASELCSLTINQWFGRQNGHIYVKRKGGAMRWLAVASYVRCLCRGLPAHQRGTQRG